MLDEPPSISTERCRSSCTRKINVFQQQQAGSGLSREAGRRARSALFRTNARPTPALLNWRGTSWLAVVTYSSDRR